MWLALELVEKLGYLVFRVARVVSSLAYLVLVRLVGVVLLGYSLGRFRCILVRLPLLFVVDWKLFGGLHLVVIK